MTGRRRWYSSSRVVVVAPPLLGGGALKKATWQTAEEHLSFAEQQAPEVSDHHFQLAILYSDTDRLELAVEELLK